MTKFLLPLVLIFHLWILSKFTFTAWPEMLSYPYLFSKGFVLYKDFILPYPPGLILILSSFFKLFGFSPMTLKIFTWIYILNIDLLIFLVLKKITRSLKLALIFLLIFVFLQSSLDGNMLWFDIATVIPLLLAFLFTLIWIEKKLPSYLFLVGVFLSLAILIKQIDIIYFPCFIIFYLHRLKKIIINDLIIFCLSTLIILLPFVLYLLFSGLLKDYWLWSIYYPITEWSKFPGYVALDISKGRLLVIGLLLLPFLGIILAIKKLIREDLFLLTGVFLMASIFAIYPRFSFFHFQPPLAFLIITYALIAKNFPIKMKKTYIFLIISTAGLIVTLTFRKNVGEQFRFYNIADQELIEKVKDMTHPNQVVYLLGSISSVYVLTDTVPPKNWGDNFGWYLEIPGVQEWVLEGINKNPPQFFFRSIPQKGNWYDLGVYQPQKIATYLYANYQKTGSISDVEIWTRKN